MLANCLLAGKRKKVLRIALALDWLQVALKLVSDTGQLQGRSLIFSQQEGERGQAVGFCTPVECKERAV